MDSKIFDKKASHECLILIINYWCLRPVYIIHKDKMIFGILKIEILLIKSHSSVSVTYFLENHT